MVTVLDGIHKTPWQLHRNVLRHHTGYFELAGRTSIFHHQCSLPEVDPVIFGYFVDRIYTTKFGCGENHVHKNVDWSMPLQWCALVIFADMVGVAQLRKHAEAAFEECFLHDTFKLALIPSSIIRFVYTQLLEASGMRQVVAQGWIKLFLQSSFSLHKEFGAAMACNYGFAKDACKGNTEHHSITNDLHCGFASCSIHTKVKKEAAKVREAPNEMGLTKHHQISNARYCAFHNCHLHADARNVVESDEGYAVNKRREEDVMAANEDSTTKRRKL